MPTLTDRELIDQLQTQQESLVEENQTLRQEVLRLADQVKDLERAYAELTASTMPQPQPDARGEAPDAMPRRFQAFRCWLGFHQPPYMVNYDTEVSRCPYCQKCYEVKAIPGRFAAVCGALMLLVALGVRWAYPIVVRDVSATWHSPVFSEAVGARQAPEFWVSSILSEAAEPRKPCAAQSIAACLGW